MFKRLRFQLACVQYYIILFQIEHFDLFPESLDLLISDIEKIRRLNGFDRCADSQHEQGGEKPPYPDFRHSGSCVSGKKSLH